MHTLSDYDLILPQIPSEEEWHRAIAHTIESLEGLSKDAATVRIRGLSLLREVNEAKATPERVGWLNLWAKAFAALESANHAFEYQSELVLQMISRCTFEWFLHVQCLFDPTINLYSIGKLSDKVVTLERSLQHELRETVVDRLRAYTAWCLWSDKVYYKEIIHPKTLEGAWDPGPAREILADENRLEMHERFLGPLNIETDEMKLNESKKEMETIYDKKIKLIDKLLSDQYLKNWKDKIEKVSEQYKKEKRGNPSFFSLFSSKDISIPKRLQKYGLRFGYSTYLSGSMTLHGATMEQFMMIGTSAIGPKVKTNESDIERYFANIVSECNHIFVLLSAINHFALKK